ncbi:hypothetical protein GCM10012289_52720 [Nonomuraea cavernae]|uniref:Uncharacterized protein n=1 Tax=Nonomuraea cavernae TaxID=2045107 RepID=A0A917Z6H5_9ACTN|nr:hypothetical protein GCM10012289_52720 [Nonomuraea cavernae]
MGYLTIVDLDEVADRLYALVPSEFTAARAAEAGAAKAAGEAGLAREITGLRKPTVSAWALNRAARLHPGELQELFDLGERLRSAWEEHDADALAELTRRRGDLTGRVGRLVKEGARLSAAAAAEVDQTLDAAVVDADAAAQVRRGRLVRPLSYSGFAPAPAPRRGPAGRKRTPDAEDEVARARQEAEERRARERQEAEAAYEEWRDAVAAAAEEHRARAEKVARIEKKLAKARRKLAETEQRLEVARREERLARRRLER